MRDDESWLRDVYDSGRLIINFTDGMDLSSFLKDSKTQSAVLHRILIMGEAVKRLSTGVRESNPEIDWRGVAGMRDKLIHDYHQVLIRRVWIVATRYVPRLLGQVEPLLQDPEA